MNNLNELYKQIFNMLNTASEKHDDNTLNMLVDVFYELAYESGCVNKIEKPKVETDEDIVKAFYNNCISVTNNRDDFIHVDDLYEQFILWTNKHEYKTKLSKTKLRYCLQEITPAIKYNCRYKRLTHIILI